MTNLDDNGHYPVSLEINFHENVSDLITEKCKSFDRYWRDHFSCFPEVVSMDWRQREEMKKFAWKIFVELIHGFDKLAQPMMDTLQKTADEAYNDGIADAKQKILNGLDEMVTTMDIAKEVVNEIE